MNWTIWPPWIEMGDGSTFLVMIRLTKPPWAKQSLGDTVPSQSVRCVSTKLYSSVEGRREMPPQFEPRSWIRNLKVEEDVGRFNTAGRRLHHNAGRGL